MTKVLALVLAGGNGTRLHPLTNEHAKPALPFALGYRIIDFVLSNLVNSKISPIYVLAQYKPRSLVEHIDTAWLSQSTDLECRISVTLPRSDAGHGVFKGTADAVYQNLELVDRHQPDVVAVFAADHVYRMDVRQMVRFHHEHNAEVTVGAVPVPIDKATSFGIMLTDSDGRIREFQEKPERPTPMPTDPHRAYASMGNYLFNRRVLVELLEDANRRGHTCFGQHILPRLPSSHRALAYDFAVNKVPGVRPCEETGYWRDIGTLDALRDAQRDVLGPLPRFSLVNPKWPVRGDVPGADEQDRRYDQASSVPLGMM
ncbi:MAG: sugar phosphate nucleotidyltransferase [Betaproteobacteria bacterium]